MSPELVSSVAVRDVLVLGLVGTVLYSYWRDGLTPVTRMVFFLTVMWILFRIVDIITLPASATVLLLGLAVACLVAVLYYSAKTWNRHLES